MNLTIAPTPKAKRDLHPRGQLAYHQRCASRANAKIDWLRELASRFPGDPNYAIDPEKDRALIAKRDAHLRACVLLNDEHALGYPVTSSMRQMLGM